MLLSQKKLISSIGLLLLLNLTKVSEAQLVIAPKPLTSGGSSGSINCTSNGTATLPCYTGSTINSGIYFNGTSTLISANGVNVATFSTTEFTSANRILIPNGTAAEPSLTSASDTTRGLWFPAANTIGITTNGSATSGITIQSGDVGIGTTNPGNNFLGGGNNPGGPLHIRGPSFTRLLLEGNNEFAAIEFGDGGGTVNARWMQLLMDSDRLTFQSKNDNGTLRNANMLVLDLATGNVGIGITPDDNFHVYNSLGTSIRIGQGNTALAAGRLKMGRDAAAAFAVGAGLGMLRWETGTNAGTLKLVAYSGTSTTGVTIVDNVGGGN